MSRDEDAVNFDDEAESSDSKYPIEITPMEEERIREIGGREDVYDLLISSFATSVFGHFGEKLALLLQTVSGGTKQLSDGTRIRGEIHIALFGEQGTPVRYLAKAAQLLAADSVTVSAVDTHDSGGFELGLCDLVRISNATILDKQHREWFLDRLESRTMTIDDVFIPTSTVGGKSLLVHGIPEQGQFGHYKPLMEQIPLGELVLNRFDLVFFQQHHCPMHKHDKLADQVLSTHTDHSESKPSTSDGNMAIELLAKYLTYANVRADPQLTGPARDVIEKFYHEERERDDRPFRGEYQMGHQDIDSLVRLSEAAARLGLSKTVEKGHAKLAIDVYRQSLNEEPYEPESELLSSHVMDPLYEERNEEWPKSLVKSIVEQFDEDGEGVSGEFVDYKAGKHGNVDDAQVLLEELVKSGEVECLDSNLYVTT
jgi:replicative DNA helicase Mcm